jgi:cell division protein FtsW (lipid II flippase)
MTTEKLLFGLIGLGLHALYSVRANNHSNFLVRQLHTVVLYGWLLNLMRLFPYRMKTLLRDLAKLFMLLHNSFLLFYVLGRVKGPGKQEGTQNS